MTVQGVQIPRIFLSPPALANTEKADAVIALAASAGLILDPWQELSIRTALSVRPDDTWGAFEVALVLPRQNGKNAILEARQLAGLFLFGERLQLHSSHEFKSAIEAFRRIVELVTNTDALRRRVKNIYRSHGDEGIELLTGQRLRFVARSGGSGRGFSANTIYFDEAFNLPSPAVAALLPTMSAIPNPQLWYTSSAGWEISTALASIRARGIAGNDTRLAYLEWSVDEDDYDIDDRDGWAQANPGLGIRITEDFVAAELAAMRADPAYFARERLGVGQWPLGESSWSVISDAQWRSLADPMAEMGSTLAFGVDITPDRQTTSIAACGLDRRHEVIEIVEHRGGTSWAIPRLIELIQKHKPVAVVLSPRAPAGSILEELESALRRIHREKVLLLTTAANEAQACQALYDSAVDSEIIRHRGQLPLDTALAGARQKILGEGAWLWNRRSTTVDISPLWAATLARWGLHAAKTTPKSFAFFD